MRQKQTKRRDVPRVYDRASGEYLPVSALRARGPAVSPAGSAALRAEKRKKRHRKALVVFYISVFLMVMTCAVVLSLTVLFKVDRIQVTGTSRYSEKEILAASGLKTGDNLFLTKTKKAEAQLLKQLPYLGTVQVSRRFPASILINVSQAGVFGAVQVRGKYAVISAGGKVVEITETLSDGCAVISGLDVRKAVAGEPIEFQSASQQSMMQNVAEALNQNGLKEITAMDFSSPSRITVQYQNRILINLGLPSDLDYKVRYAKTLLDTGKIEPSEKGTLNLSTAADTDTAYFDPDTGSG